MRVKIASGTPCRTRVPRQHAIAGGVFCFEAAMIRTIFIQKIFLKLFFS